MVVEVNLQDLTSRIGDDALNLVDLLVWEEDVAVSEGFMSSFNRLTITESKTKYIFQKPLNSSDSEISEF